MFIKLNERVYLNTDKITRIKINEIKNSIRIHFFEGSVQIAKSKKFDSFKDAQTWIKENIQ